MGLSSYNTPEIQAYDGLIKLIAAAKDLINNPPDLQQARLDALKTIEEAKTASANLDASHAEKMTVHQQTADKLNAKSQANEAKALEFKNAQKDLDGKSATLSILAAKLETLKTSLDAKESNLVSRETELNKLNDSLSSKEQTLLALESKLMGIEKMLSDKNDTLTHKETALRQFLA